MLKIDLLKKLCNLCAPSGNEEKVRDFIISEISEYADDIKTDTLGNLIVFKKGRKKPTNKILLAAHMDEVGFIVSDIRSDGLLKFKNIGGMMDEALTCKEVKFTEKDICGVIGTKPVHVLKGEEKNRNITSDELYIDIGCDTRNDAEKYVSLGDCLTFKPNFHTFDNIIKSKAIDDRVGCSILISIIQSELEYDAYFAFNVQEEVGTRGAITSSYEIAPDSCIVIEATTASDLCGVKDENKICCLNQGPVISFMDRGTIYDRHYFELAKKCAVDNNIKYQIKRGVVGANDSASIHCSRGGVKTIALSLPCRYLHSSCSIAGISDVNALFFLTEVLFECIAQS